MHPPHTVRLLDTNVCVLILRHVKAKWNSCMPCVSVVHAATKKKFYALLPNCVIMLHSSKVQAADTGAVPHSSSELGASSAPRAAPVPRRRDVPAPPALPPSSPGSKRGLPGMRFPTHPPSGPPGTPIGFPGPPPATNPLHIPTSSNSMDALGVSTIVPILLACIDMCVATVALHTTSTEACEAQFAQRKKTRRGEEVGCSSSPHSELRRRGDEEEELDHHHVQQIFDLLAWHIGVLDARWWVKPRSTCWFEEYLFNIYTPEMFYDILRMRRRTFDRLVECLRPHIQGQHTHWREPIGVEKKVVVTLFKLMHGATIPLVADRAALGKSTVGEILRQVCSAICNNFGHLIAWPVGRRLARTAAAFESKGWLPNCIGAIDGSHIYISSPSNTIVAADHRNRNKSFSILLQGVVDSKCYFTSINTGPPGSLHDSAHFRSTELYKRVEEGTMGGFHDDPLSWPSALPFPPYIVADRGYPLLSWCITPFKMGPTGAPLSSEETWFNRKHSSTRMSVERAFGILKARFKEIGTKSSMKLEFLPTVVHCCCVLHNILLASKDRTLDQILIDCNLPPMDAQPARQEGEEAGFRPPRPMGLVGEDRALLEGQMSREDILDYLVRIHNANHTGNHGRRRAT